MPNTTPQTATNVGVNDAFTVTVAGVSKTNGNQYITVS